MQWTKLLLCLGGSQLAGILGAFFTRAAIPGWYALLKKPSFTPPNWLFGPAWITLYLLMGIAAYLVWRQGLTPAGVRPALSVFLVQLALNALWSPVFFGLRSPLAGVIVIVLLWLAIVITIFLFWQVSKPAALLLIPYIIWVSYASLLNISIWLLNR